MKLEKIVKLLELQVLSAADNLDIEVKSGYASDLLSDVIANSRESSLWITLQIHQNIVAVGKLKDLAGIILVNSREPDKETVRKAEEEHLPLLQSRESAFEVAGKLFDLLKTEN